MYSNITFSVVVLAGTSLNKLLFFNILLLYGNATNVPTLIMRNRNTIKNITMGILTRKAIMHSIRVTKAKIKRKWRKFSIKKKKLHQCYKDYINIGRKTQHNLKCKKIHKMFKFYVKNVNKKKLFKKILEVKRLPSAVKSNIKQELNYEKYTQGQTLRKVSSMKFRSFRLRKHFLIKRFFAKKKILRNKKKHVLRLKTLISKISFKNAKLF